jgi:Ca2+-binding EF-hand superfamily protein
MREYFGSLGDSAHPDSPDPRTRAITRFQELLLVAFREFSVITEESISSERSRFRKEIVNDIESFSKRAAIRNLRTPERFSKDSIGLIYDAFYKAICIVPPPSSLSQPIVRESLVDDGKVPEREETRIGLQTFRIFLSEVATWARDEKIVKNGFQARVDRELPEHELIDRLFFFWDQSNRGALTFQDVVTGLDVVLHNDLMGNIEWFFTLHDKNKDGFLTKDEVLTLSEALLFIFRYEIGDAYLGAVSRFMTNVFEYGDALLQQDSEKKGEELGNNQPYLNLATCVLTLTAAIYANLKLDSAWLSLQTSYSSPSLTRTSQPLSVCNASKKLPLRPLTAAC